MTSIRLHALRCAFPYTVPILAGFWFLGMAYGMYAHVSGFSFWYPLAMSMLIFGGSLEFIAVSLLLAPFAPLQTLIVTVLVQARHLFYGLSMLDKWKRLGWKKGLLIFWMCDETFSICYTADVPDGVDRGWFYFWIAFLDYVYWVSGAMMGAFLGNLIQFDLTGLDFVMTAMFVVIFMEQWFHEKSHASSFLGAIAGIGCLAVFGPDQFMIPTMLCILLGLTVFRKALDRGEEGDVS